MRLSNAPPNHGNSVYSSSLVPSFTHAEIKIDTASLIPLLPPSLASSGPGSGSGLSLQRVHVQARTDALLAFVTGVLQLFPYTGPVKRFEMEEIKRRQDTRRRQSCAITYQWTTTVASIPAWTWPSAVATGVLDFVPRPVPAPLPVPAFVHGPVHIPAPVPLELI